MTSCIIYAIHLSHTHKHKCIIHNIYTPPTISLDPLTWAVHCASYQFFNLAWAPVRHWTFLGCQEDVWVIESCVFGEVKLFWEMYCSFSWKMNVLLNEQNNMRKWKMYLFFTVLFFFVICVLKMCGKGYIFMLIMMFYVYIFISLWLTSNFSCKFL